MLITRRDALGFLAGSAALAAAPAHAQAIRTLDITVPGGPGSGLDQVARAVEETVRQDRLAPAIRINNVAGGGGMIALSQFVTTKRGNAQACVVQGAGTVFFPLTNRTSVSLADVRPLARLAGEYEVIAVRSNSPLMTLGDLLARLRADPGAITLGGGAAASTDHIFFARVARQAGVEARRINYVTHANTGDVVVSALNGQAAAVAGGLQDFFSQVQSGRMRVLAVASPERLPGVEAPTLRELGIDIVFANWRGVSVHPSLTDAQVKTMADFFAGLVRAPRWQQIMQDRGWLDLYLPEAEYLAFIRRETELATEILTELGMVNR